MKYKIIATLLLVISLLCFLSELFFVKTMGAKILVFAVAIALFVIALIIANKQ